MKTKILFSLAFLALAGRAFAQTPVAQLLYVQSDVVSIPDSTDLAALSAGEIYGSKAISAAALAPGQAFRIHVAGTISTGAAVQKVMPYLDLDDAVGIMQLQAAPVPIPGGLSVVRFALDATVTLVRAPYGIRLFAANSDCSITVNGSSYSIPFPGLAFGPVGTVGDSVNLNVRWAWTTHDPANSLTVTTLIVEWLR